MQTQEEKIDNMSELIKCDNCGQILIEGSGTFFFFSAGTKIKCNSCGNEYTFPEKALITPKSEE